MGQTLRLTEVQRRTNPGTSKWANGSNTAYALGISERTLTRWRSTGLLKPGRHWRRKFPNKNSPVLYDIPSVELLMREVAARDINYLEQVETA